MLGQNTSPVAEFTPVVDDKDAEIISERRLRRLTELQSQRKICERPLCTIELERIAQEKTSRCQQKCFEATKEEIEDEQINKEAIIDEPEAIKTVAVENITSEAKETDKNPDFETSQMENVVKSSPLEKDFEKKGTGCQCSIL